MTTVDLAICRNEGRRAFRERGVTGRRANPYRGEETTALESMAFVEGFTAEKNAAHSRALDEAIAYHRLSVRDNVVDRQWAARLSGVAG